MLDVFRELRKAKHVWIYGAGEIGKKALKLLSMKIFHLPLEGIVVSQYLDEKREIDGYVIKELKDSTFFAEGTIFVIAVSSKYQMDIIETLLSEGYENYIVWEYEFLKRIWCLADFQFENRQKGLKKLCYVLSGYKEFLWDSIFERLVRFIPEDLEVCILSSGVKSNKLSKIAKKNGWSYLYTSINDITLIQNIVISIFPDAEWIYKMDEDIFVTRNCFENMLRTYQRIEAQEPYHIGFIAPLIPVNGYGYIHILNYLKKLNVYEKKFGRAICGGNFESMIEKESKTAEFMWGENAEIPVLDELNHIFSKNQVYSVCGVRFSIGFILFKPKIWEDMGGFTVSGDKDLGVDEIELCQYCIIHSLAMIIAENSVVGHFSFGKQTEGMKKLYHERPDLFQIRQVEICEK